MTDRERERLQLSLERANYALGIISAWAAYPELRPDPEANPAELRGMALTRAIEEYPEVRDDDAA